MAESPVSNKELKPKDNVRLGLVGAGAISQLAHLPVLSKLKGAELVALCDNDGPKASAIAERLKIPDVFTDIEDLLELDQVDAVVIATPNHLHEPHVLRALKSKVDVLCERPLSLTSRGVEQEQKGAVVLGEIGERDVLPVATVIGKAERSVVDHLDEALRSAAMLKIGRAVSGCGGEKGGILFGDKLGEL